MNCEHCERKLPDLLVHRLDPKVASAVQLHLGSCRPCREYLERVRAVYAVPETDALYRSRPPGGPPALGRAGRRRAAAVGLGLAAAGLALWGGALLVGGGRELPADGAPLAVRPASFALEPIRLELPEEPPPFRPGAWLSSREEAGRLSAYTGLPILEEFVWRDCPRCKGMEEALRPTLLPVLEAFVLCRRFANDGLPDDLAAQHPALPADAVYPAVRVVAPDCETPAAWSVDRLGTVEDVVAEYYDGCVAPRGDPREALDPELFEWARATLASVPGLVLAGELREALERLRATRALEGMYRTRFVDDARALEHQLTREVETRVAVLEEHGERVPRQGPEREALRQAAGALLEEVRGLTLAARLEPLAR